MTDSTGLHGALKTGTLPTAFAEAVIRPGPHGTLLAATREPVECSECRAAHYFFVLTQRVQPPPALPILVWDYRCLACDICVERRT